MNDRSPELGLRYGDLAVLGQLIEAGADLTEPRHVVHYLYFDGQGAARAASSAIRSNAFEVTIREPEQSSPDWAVICERHDDVLHPDSVRTTTDLFEAVAAEHGGSYDGWEASVN